MAFIPDGFSTFITFGDGNNAIRMLEKEVAPGGVEVGSIDITTMRSIKIRPKWPKSLRTIEDIVIQAAYDPGQLSVILAMISGVPGPFGTSVAGVGYLYVTFPETTTWRYEQVWLDSFKPASLKEGEFPLAEVKFIFSGTTIPGYGTRGSGTPTYNTPLVNGNNWF